MRPWLLSAALAVFIVGGFVGGAIGIHNLSTLSRPARQAPDVAAVSPAEVARPVATPELASHPPLRDFDENPPPFGPAAPADVATPAPVQTPPADAATTVFTFIACFCSETAFDWPARSVATTNASSLIVSSPAILRPVGGRSKSRVAVAAGVTFRVAVAV